MRKLTGIVAVLALAVPGAAVHAQAVYKCSARSYSQAPCSSRVVQTYDAPVELPTRKGTIIVAHRLPGESAEQYATRKKRANLSETDRDECARLDRKMPVERERLKASGEPEEVDALQDSIGETRKRYKQLHC
jgi:hypothetical protein